VHTVSIACSRLHPVGEATRERLSPKNGTSELGSLSATTSTVLLEGFVDK
jgi:hypothetical protein